jgi:hypothetical protein
MNVALPYILAAKKASNLHIRWLLQLMDSSKFVKNFNLQNSCKISLFDLIATWAKKIKKIPRRPDNCYERRSNFWYLLKNSKIQNSWNSRNSSYITCQSSLCHFVSRALIIIIQILSICHDSINWKSLLMYSSYKFIIVTNDMRPLDLWKYIKVFRF